MRPEPIAALVKKKTIAPDEMERDRFLLQKLRTFAPVEGLKSGSIEALPWFLIQSKLTQVAT